MKRPRPDGTPSIERWFARQTSAKKRAEYHLSLKSGPGVIKCKLTNVNQVDESNRVEEFSGGDERETTIVTASERLISQNSEHTRVTILEKEVDQLKKLLGDIIHRKPEYILQPQITYTESEKVFDDNLPIIDLPEVCPISHSYDLLTTVSSNPEPQKTVYKKVPRQPRGLNIVSTGCPYHTYLVGSTLTAGTTAVKAGVPQEGHWVALWQHVQTLYKSHLLEFKVVPRLNSSPYQPIRNPESNRHNSEESGFDLVFQLTYLGKTYAGSSLRAAWRAMNEDLPEIVKAYNAVIVTKDTRLRDQLYEGFVCRNRSNSFEDCTCVHAVNQLPHIWTPLEHYLTDTVTGESDCYRTALIPDNLIKSSKEFLTTMQQHLENHQLSIGYNTERFLLWQDVERHNYLREARKYLGKIISYNRDISQRDRKKKLRPKKPTKRQETKRKPEVNSKVTEQIHDTYEEFVCVWCVDGTSQLCQPIRCFNCNAKSVSCRFYLNKLLYDALTKPHISPTCPQCQSSLAAQEIQNNQHHSHPSNFLLYDSRNNSIYSKNQTETELFLRSRYDRDSFTCQRCFFQQSNWIRKSEYVLSQEFLQESFERFPTNFSSEEERQEVLWRCPRCLLESCGVCDSPITCRVSERPWLRCCSIEKMICYQRYDLLDAKTTQGIATHWLSYDERRIALHWRLFCIRMIKQNRVPEPNIISEMLQISPATALYQELSADLAVVFKKLPLGIYRFQNAISL